MSTGHERDRFELLAAIGEVADGTLLLDETVARLLGFVVPAFADVATLDSISPDGVLRRVGSRVEGPGREELETALLRRRPLPEAPVGLPAAIASAESQLLERDRRAPADDRRRRGGLRAASRARAALGAVRAAPGTRAHRRGARLRRRHLRPQLRSEDLRYAEILSGHLALALDNATLSPTLTGLERRLEVTLTNLAEAVIVRDADGQSCSPTRRRRGC